VAVEELKFGDNDMLSRARCQTRRRQAHHPAHQRGWIDGPGHRGTLIPKLGDIDEVFRHVRDDKGRFSMGGMASKLKP
jgi:glutamate 5-kinase